MRLARRFPIVLITVLLFAVASGFAQNVRSAVSITGTDAATCTVPDPCRTFTAAMARTNPGGEVIALASGGYGPFTITQAVSVISPLAFHAAIAPTTGAAITVNAPDETVIIRGLYLNSQGASHGITVSAAAVLHLENLVVNGFSGNGIGMFQSGAAFIKDSGIRNGGVGIIGTPASANGTAMMIDRVRLESNFYGMVLDSAVRATVRDTIAAQNSFHSFWFRSGGPHGGVLASVENSLASESSGEDSAGGGGGFLVQDGARVSIRNSAAIRAGADGFRAFSNVQGVTTQLVLDQCLATENTYGIRAGGSGAGTAIITVSNSTASVNFNTGIAASANGTVRAFGNTVTNNITGLRAEPTGLFESAGHNMVRGNATETVGTIAPIPTM